MILLLTLLLPPTIHPFELVPNNGKFLNGHYLYQTSFSNMCETKQDISFTLDTNEMDNLLQNTKTISAKFDEQALKIVTEFKTSNDYKIVGKKRFYLEPTPKTYPQALLICQEKNASIVEASHENINNIITLSKQLQPVQTKVWQSINLDKNVLFTLSNLAIPSTYNNLAIASNLRESSDQTQCVNFVTDPLKFETVDCTDTALTICETHIQPTDIARLTITTSNLKTALSELQHQVYSLKKQTNLLPDIDMKPGLTPYTLFDPALIETSLGLTQLSASTIKTSIIPFTQFINAQTKKLSDFKSALSAKSINFLFSVVEECTHVYNPTDVNIASKVLTKIGKNNSKIILLVNEYDTCKTYPVIRVLPFVKAKGLETNVIFLTDKCVETPESCMSSFCQKDEFKENTCCKSLFNTTTNLCPMLTNLTSFYLQLNQTTYFSSSTPLTLKGNCAPKGNVTRGILTTNPDCEITDIPFLPTTKTFSFSFFGEDGLPVLSLTDSKNSPTLLMLITIISSLVTVVLSTTAMCLYFCKRNPFRQSTPRATTDEIHSGSGNITLTSILKTPRECRHSREVYFSRGSDKSSTNSSDSDD